MILKSKSDIEKLFKTSKRIKTSHFNILIACNEHESKVLFAVSKVIKNHVLKNRAKRILRELVRQNPNLLTQPKHVAFIAKPSILGCSFSTVRDELEKVAHLIQ